MNSNDTVEFKLHIQNIKGKNLVDNFVNKIKEGFLRKGIQKDIDYHIKVVNNNSDMFKKKGAMYGGSDSTFPYSLFEQLFDYIDNNVRVIKPEHIRTDKYVKTQDAKKRTLDGLFSKADEKPINPENVIDTPVEKIKNTWDELFLKKGEQYAAEEKVDNLQQISQTQDQPQPNYGKDIDDAQQISQSQSQDQPKYGKDIDDVHIPDKNASPTTTNEEIEYIVTITLNKKYVKMCIHNKMSKRELMKVLE